MITYAKNLPILMDITSFRAAAKRKREKEQSNTHRDIAAGKGAAVLSSKTNQSSIK